MINMRNAGGLSMLRKLLEKALGMSADELGDFAIALIGFSVAFAIILFTLVGVLKWIF